MWWVEHGDFINYAKSKSYDVRVPQTYCMKTSIDVFILLIIQSYEFNWSLDVQKNIAVKI